MPDNTVGGLEGIQIQGISSDYIQILIDGVPSIGRLSGNLSLDRFTLLNIERIEIIKGPSSSLYGSAALGGVINIITKKSFNSLPDFSFNQSIGSNSTFDSNISYGQKIKKSNVSISLNRFSTTGYDLNENDDYKTVNPYSNYTINPVFNTEIGKDLLFFQSIKLYKQNQDALNYDFIQNEISSHSKISKSLRNNNNIEFEFYYSDFQNKDYLKSDQSLDSYFFHKIIKPEIRYFKSFNDKSNLLLGFSLDKETLDRSLFSNVVNSDLYNLFFQYEFDFFKNTKVVIGSRFDNPSNYNDKLSSKISIKHYLDNFSFNLSLGQGFKAPDFRQLYLNFSNSISGYSVFGKFEEKNGIDRLNDIGELLNLLVDYEDLGGVLLPESSIGLNIGVSFNSNQFKSKLNFFRNDIKNMIDTRILARKINGQNVFGYLNLDKILTQGFEFQNSINFLEKFNANIGYQLLFAYNKENLNQVRSGNVYARNPNSLESIKISMKNYLGLPNRSRHNVNLKFSYNNEFFLRTIYRSKYAVFDSNGNDFIDDYDSSIIKPHLIFNFTYAKNISDKVRASLTFKNIFNYINPDYMPNISGRQIFVKFKYSNL